MDYLAAISVMIMAILLIGCTASSCLAEDSNVTSGSVLLTTVSNALLKSLDTIDQNLSAIATVFGEADANSTLDSIVDEKQIDKPGWAGVILIAGDKTYTTLNPSVITGPLNTSITDDPAIRDSIKYIKPKMGAIRDISDVDQGVAISRPAVVGDLIGSAVALIIPWSLCESVIRPRINGTNTLSVVMQKDGTILYTSHPTELTKVPPDTFLTEFPTFRDVQTAMKKEKEGHIIYELWRAERTDPHAREAYWNTIYLHGNEWRVLVASAIK